jgi:hypothetical protein
MENNNNEQFAKDFISAYDKGLKIATGEKPNGKSMLTWLNELTDEAKKAKISDEYIGKQVKMIREQNHLSQEEFAKRINTTSRIVSAVELSHICKIDEIFNDYDDLNDFVEEFLIYVCKEFNVDRDWFDINRRSVYGQ